MTSINLTTDIPSNINTLEQLAMWAIIALSNTNPTAMALEGQGYSEQAAQAGIFYVPAASKHRFLGRISLEVDPNYVAGGSKLWKFPTELSATALNANLKTN